MKSKTLRLQHVEVELLPEKAVYLPAFKVLCIADWHLGKAAHFRKAGIPLPQPDLSAEFDKIAALVARFGAEQVILLGDVFHSKLNNDWKLFEAFIASHPGIRWTITMGNHDIIGKEQFLSLGMDAVDELVLGETVICTHHPRESVPENQLNIAGHVHPGCEIVTGARQRFRLPCFHYGNSVLTLPAFGGLTGLFMLQADEHNRLFVIVGDEIREKKL